MFDTSTESGRAQVRHRRALLTFAANVFARILGLVALYVSLRVSLPYLGPERYGALATILGFSNLLMFLDLGIGNALIGQVAKARATSREAPREVISAGVWTLCILGLSIGAVLALGAQHIPLEWLFKNAQPVLIRETRETLVAFAVVFGASIPLAGIPKIFNGLQEGYLPHLMTGTFSIMSVCVLLALPGWRAGMPTFLVVSASPPLLTGLALLPVLIRKGHLALPRRGTLSSLHAAALFRAGGLFFLLQLGVMAGWGADSLIISSRLGPADVAVFTVAQRLFLLVSVPLTMALSPLWSAYADAMTRGDRDYIHETFRRSRNYCLWYASGTALLLILFGGPLSQAITGGGLRLSLPLLLFYGAWSIVEAWGNAVAMMANGLHVIKPQVSVVLLFIALALPLKIALIHWLGVDYIPLLTLISYFLAVMIPYHTIFRSEIFIWIRQ